MPTIPTMTPMSPHGVPLDLALGYAERLLTRRDTYAVQQPDGRYQRIVAPVDRDTLVAHLSGIQTVALYTLDGRRMARWLCFDADGADGLAQLLAVQRAFAALGITTLREASRRGGHLWLLCGQYVPAELLRGMAFGVLALLAARGDLLDEVAQRIEVYPSVDALGAGGYSQAVRIPFGVHRRTGLIYPFLEVGARPAHGLTVEEGLHWFVAQPLASPALVRSALRRLGSALEEALDSVALVLGDASLSLQIEVDDTDAPELPDLGTGQASLIALVNATVDLPELIAEMTPHVQLRPVGQGFGGWCPFHDDVGTQGDGQPGAPSLYVVNNWRYGWSWRCYSVNCGAYRVLMQHTFDWLVMLTGGDVQRALNWARTRCQQGPGRRV